MPHPSPLSRQGLTHSGPNSIADHQTQTTRSPSLADFTTLSFGIVLAYFIAAMSPNMDVANAALPTYVVTLLFFAGFLLRFNDIPEYWRW